MNTVALRGPMGAGEAEALADELQAELSFRRVTTGDDALAAGLVALGWSDEPLLLLGRDGALEPPEAPALAEEVPYGHVRGLRDEWLRSRAWASGEQQIRDAHEAVIAAVLHAARAERHELVFVPTDADGRARSLYERLGFEPLAIDHRLMKGTP